MIQYFTFIEGINMDISELTNILDNSNLAPYEVATALYMHLKPKVEYKLNYCDLDTLEDNADLMLFYLALKQFKD